MISGSSQDLLLFPPLRSCCDSKSLRASSAVSCPRSLLVSRTENSTAGSAGAWDRNTAGTGVCGVFLGMGHRAAELPDPSVRLGTPETLGNWGMAPAAELRAMELLASGTF